MSFMSEHGGDLGCFCREGRPALVGKTKCWGNDLSQGEKVHGPNILRTQSPQTVIWFLLVVSRNKKAARNWGIEPQHPSLSSHRLMM